MVPRAPELYEHYSELSHALHVRMMDGGGNGKGINITSEVASVWFEKVCSHAKL